MSKKLVTPDDILGGLFKEEKPIIDFTDTAPADNTPAPVDSAAPAEKPKDKDNTKTIIIVVVVLIILAIAAAILWNHYKNKKTITK